MRRADMARPPPSSPSPEQFKMASPISWVETSGQDLEGGKDAERRHSQSSQQQQDASAWKPGRREWAVMVTIAVVSVMVALDATILVPVLPSLAEELDGNTTDAFWAGTSYLLACAVFQPLIASLSDIFGRKEMLLVAIAFFTLGNLLCAPLARTFTVLFAGRTLQGIGGGGIITMGQVIFADIVPLRQRPKYFALVLGAWALGSVLGPWLGGLFVRHLDWRWCFYVNFPFCLLGFVMVPVCVRLEAPRSSLASKLARVDWLGAFLFIGGMTSFLIGLSWAGIQFAWLSVTTIAPMAVGLCSVALALVWERFGAREPMLRPSLFYSPSAVAAYLCALCQGFLLFCALYYVPLYFMAVKTVDAVQAGLDLFPVTCVMVPGSIVVSLLTSRLGRFRWAIWSGWVITATGCGLFLLLKEDTTTVVWAAIFCVFGLGNGMVLTSVNVAIQAISRVEDTGRAASMYAFMRTMGMCIGVAVGGTTFQNVMSKKLGDLGLPQSIAHNAEAFISQLEQLAPGDATRVGATEAYVAGLHGVFWVMTGTALFGFVAGLVVRRHSMDKILESKFVLAGGAGSALRSTTDVVEKRMKRMSRHAAEMLLPPVAHSALARLSRYSAAGGTFYLNAEAAGSGIGRARSSTLESSSSAGASSVSEDELPILPGPYGRATPMAMASVTSFLVPPSIRSVRSGRSRQSGRSSWRSAWPMPLGVNNKRPLGVNAPRSRLSLARAPVVAFYIAPGNRRVPIDIMTDSPIAETYRTLKEFPTPPMPTRPTMPTIPSLPSNLASFSASQSTITRADGESEGEGSVRTAKSRRGKSEWSRISRV